MLKAKVDSAEIQAALDRLTLATSNLKPAFDTIGAGLVDNMRLSIREGKTPWNDPYAPLKKLRRNNQDPRISDVPLNDTRQHIYNKLTHKATRSRLTVGILEKSPIAATHQFGSQSKNIPARAFLPIRENGSVDLPREWEQEIIDAIEIHISDAF